jgi:hypothetical protein
MLISITHQVGKSSLSLYRRHLEALFVGFEPLSSGALEDAVQKMMHLCLTEKQLRKTLEEEFNVSLKDRKAFIRSEVRALTSC